MKKVAALFAALSLPVSAQINQVVSDPYFNENPVGYSYTNTTDEELLPMGKWYSDVGTVENGTPFDFGVPYGNPFYGITELNMIAVGDNISRIYQFIDLDGINVTPSTMFVLNLYYRRLSDTSPLIDVDYRFYNCADTSNPIIYNNCSYVSVRDAFYNGRTDDPAEYLLINEVMSNVIMPDNHVNRMKISVTVWGTDENAALNQVELLIIE